RDTYTPTACVRLPTIVHETLVSGRGRYLRPIDSQRATLCNSHMNTRLLMTLRVTVAAPQNIAGVPHGTRRTVPITGGDFDGPWLRGLVLPGGSGDWLLLRADGVLELDFRATLRT